ncbi:hypothetical protein [Halococcus saccharolyticus]|uniref:Uncharacterized protein n=1 Tax=Halococcus saccharolyticus DSM 5350 TaxID=1227455 RepID=M0MHX3_9EURY|nr:hypothetical protein [Halococcus saccharolyticus]EMA44000.1 hypothetical protein C449_10748 [Halococcus saccharolyticus DSM 5350]
MADTILLGIAGVVIFQFILGLFIYMDANRRELDHSGMYFYGVSIPIVGFLILAAYLSRREELPTQDFAPPTATETATDGVWTIENRGLRRLPRRLVYTIQDGQTLWRVAVTGPPILLTLSALVDARIATALSGFCCLFWLTYLGTANAFTDTTIRLDPADGTIQMTWRGGDHPLSPSGSEQEVDLAGVQRVELRRVGTQPLAILRYEARFSVKPRAVLVPASQLDVLRELFASHDIPIRDRIEEGTSKAVVRRRNAEGLISLVIIPFGAGVVWPQFFFIGPVVALAFFIALWLVVKWSVGMFDRIRSLLTAFSDQY